MPERVTSLHPLGSHLSWWYVMIICDHDTWTTDLKITTLIRPPSWNYHQSSKVLGCLKGSPWICCASMRMEKKSKKHATYSPTLVVVEKKMVRKIPWCKPQKKNLKKSPTITKSQVSRVSLYTPPLRFIAPLVAPPHNSTGFVLLLIEAWISHRPVQMGGHRAMESLTASFPTEKWWLEDDDCFLLGWQIFQGRTVKLREGTIVSLQQQFHDIYFGAWKKSHLKNMGFPPILGGVFF